MPFLLTNALRPHYAPPAGAAGLLEKQFWFQILVFGLLASYLLTWSLSSYSFCLCLCPLGYCLCPLYLYQSLALVSVILYIHCSHRYAPSAKVLYIAPQGRDFLHLPCYCLHCYYRCAPSAIFLLYWAPLPTLAFWYCSLSLYLVFILVSCLVLFLG